MDYFYIADEQGVITKCQGFIEASAHHEQVVGRGLKAWKISFTKAKKLMKQKDKWELVTYDQYHDD